MTYEVKLVEAAERDLREAYEYVAYDLGVPGAAAKLIRDIR